MTLCGISSRFQLLSPTERQVSHALLTRSPLSYLRRNNPVRLACVRHAASVRPEPGSNSQKVVFQGRSLKIKFLNNLLLAIITQEFSLAVSIRSYTRTLKQIHYLSKVFKFVFTLFNLQGTDFQSSFRAATVAAAANFDILAHLVEFVKHFFQVFSNSFVLFVDLQVLAFHRTTLI